jgi:mannose-6-phosphate isomerase-like protein (cupin superfamily)
MKIVRLRDLEWVPASHEDPQAAGVVKKVLFKESDFIEGHPQMVNWCRLRAGMSFQAHYHEDMEEIFIILKGNVRLRVGEEEAYITREEAVVIPPPKVHEMKNEGDEEVEYIVIGISQRKGGKTVTVPSNPSKN